MSEGKFLYRFGDMRIVYTKDGYFIEERSVDLLGAPYWGRGKRLDLSGGSPVERLLIEAAKELALYRRAVEASLEHPMLDHEKADDWPEYDHPPKWAYDTIQMQLEDVATRDYYQGSRVSWDEVCASQRLDYNPDDWR